MSVGGSFGGCRPIVVEASQEMGNDAGTRWAMTGAFTRIEAPVRLTYDATHRTEDDEADSTIHHTNDIALRVGDDTTTVTLDVNITAIEPKAKLAAFGMKWAYKAHLDALGELLT